MNSAHPQTENETQNAKDNYWTCKRLKLLCFADIHTGWVVGPWVGGSMPITEVFRFVSVRIPWWFLWAREDFAVVVRVILPFPINENNKQTMNKNCVYITTYTIFLKWSLDKDRKKTFSIWPPSVKLRDSVTNPQTIEPKNTSRYSSEILSSQIFRYLSTYRRMGKIWLKGEDLCMKQQELLTYHCH